MPLFVDDDAPPRRDCRVLVVDRTGDEAVHTFRRLLRLEGLDVETARVPSLLLATALSYRPHVIIVPDLDQADGPSAELLLMLSQVPDLADARLVGVVSTLVVDDAFDTLVARGVILQTSLHVDDSLFGDDGPPAPVRAK